MILSIDSDAFRQTIRFPWLLLGGQITFINFLCTFFGFYFIGSCSNLYYFICSIGIWFDILSLSPTFLKWNLRLLTRSFLFLHKHFSYKFSPSIISLNPLLPILFFHFCLFKMFAIFSHNLLFKRFVSNFFVIFSFKRWFQVYLIFSFCINQNTIH